MKIKSLVILASVMLLLAISIMSCTQPAPETKIVKETVVVEKAVEKVVEKQVTVVVQPTAAPTKPPATPVPTAVPPAIGAMVRVVPVSANANVAQEPNAITTTFKIMTDTAVTTSTATRGQSTSGLTNVPVNVPVHVECVSEDAKNAGKPAWTFTKPAASKSTLVFTNTKQTEFTPDVIGQYMLTCNLGTGFEVNGVQLNVGTYVGVGTCKTCHPTYTTEWAKTNHATLFARELDNKYNSLFGQATDYSESCSICHTTGFYPGFAGTGGYFDVKAATKWTFPTWKEITAGGNWDKAPAEIKNMAVIGCEACHGPASEHVKGAKVMEASLEPGVCNQCHGASSKHSRGWQFVYSGHSNEKLEAWEISGPAEQGCIRCHSGKGFITFLNNIDPKTGKSNQAAWNNEGGPLGCASCHDPHNDTNVWQLRVVGKPVDINFEVKADVGLSATCYECHNTRRVLEDQTKAIESGGTPSYPHYSSAAELVSDLGGYEYKQTLPKGIHGMLGLGTKAIAAPASTDPLAAKFLFTRAEAKTGQIPGSCVVCHMWNPTITDAKDPNYMKVGQHSFNTVSPDGKFQYLASCNQAGCHSGTLKTFDKPASGDWDGNGKTEGVQTEIKGLLNATWKGLEAKGWKKATSNPYATIPTTADAKQKAAWYNFRTVYGAMWTDTAAGNEGKAAAIHNTKRSCALLQLSLKDLNGALQAGAADCTK